jgi:hypothetical protein
MRRELFFEAAQTDTDDEAAPLTAQRQLEDGGLRMRIFARDVGNERDPRARHGLSAFDALRQRIEDLGGAQTAQVERHAHEAFAVANILAGLIDIELRDHQREVIGRSNRVGRLAVDVDEVRKVAEIEVAAPFLERGDRQIDRVSPRDRIRRLRSRRALEMHVDLRLRHCREPPLKLRPRGGE